MQKVLAVFLGIGFIGLMGLSYLIGMNNSLVNLDEQVNQSWSQVQNVYQRRADLIPNLVETVKGYAGHEKGTLEAVIKARAEATKVSLDISKATPAQLQQYQASQGQLSQALGRLMMVTEQYPDLKANANFMDLQKQLEGTENRITVERMKFNEVTKDFNFKVRAFPSSMMASFKGMNIRPYFEADATAKEAPKVKF